MSENEAKRERPFVLPKTGVMLPNAHYEIPEGDRREASRDLKNESQVDELHRQWLQLFDLLEREVVRRANQ